jgi:hypothetical protein
MAGVGTISTPMSFGTASKNQLYKAGNYRKFAELPQLFP